MIKRFKFLKNIGLYKEDTTADVEVDKNGIPLDIYLRRRYFDSKTDGCMEEVQSKKGVSK